MTQLTLTAVDALSARLAAICITFMAMAAFLILPLFVGAAAQDLGLSPGQIGLMASVILGMSGLSSVIMMLVVRRVPWRHAARGVLALLLAGMIASLFADSATSFILCQGLAGLGGGAAYSLALTVLSDSRHADRDFGLSVAAQVSFQVLGMLTLPALVERTGVDGILLLLISLQATGFFLVRYLPQSGRSLGQGPRAGRVFTLPVCLSLAGCFFFFFNVGAVWAYIERIAVLAGLSASQIGNSLAIGVAAGIPGALLASWAGERFGRLGPLTLGAAGTLMALWLLGAGMSLGSYILAAVIYNFVWNFSLTYQYATVNAVDGSGRAVAAAPAFHAAGGAAGPGIAAMFVTENSLSAVNTLAATSVIISLLAFALAIGAVHRRLATAAEPDIAPSTENR